jgi:hypothetical protein
MFEEIHICQHFNNTNSQILTSLIVRSFQNEADSGLHEKKVLSIPMCEWPVTDEHFCATYASVHIKVHMKDKSHKFGYKLIQLCVDTGFAHKTEIYYRQVNDNKFWEKLRNPIWEQVAAL